MTENPFFEPWTMPFSLQFSMQLSRCHRSTDLFHECEHALV